MQVIVNKDQERLDIWLASQLGISRSQAQKMIKGKNVTVNSQVVKKASLPLKKYDMVVFSDDALTNEIVPVAQEMPLDILFEDEYFLAVNKPQGQLVYPAHPHDEHTLVNGLLAYTQLAKGTSSERPGIVHRLDRDTSGVLLAAKQDRALDELIQLFKNRKIKKTYLALVEGIPKDVSGTINMPLGRQKKNRLKMGYDELNGKMSITHYRLYGYNTSLNQSVLEIQLETGTMHQIRAHLALIGLPIIGDWLYGTKSNTYGFNGQALHAYQLMFQHPFKDELVQITARPPEIFLEAMRFIDIN